MKIIVALFCFGLISSHFLYSIPSQIIICRHGEKSLPSSGDSASVQEDKELFLNHTGQERAQALKQYLGIKRVYFDVLEKGQHVDAIFAITLRTVQTISPTADNWQIPIQVYMATGDTRLDGSTEQAVDEIMHNPRYHNKVVLICWEHDHIASNTVSPEYTLRSLLNLDQLPKNFDVPKVWPDTTFNYFWVIQYDTEKNIPTHFKMVQQIYKYPYNDLPMNTWGKPE